MYSLINVSFLCVGEPEVPRALIFSPQVLPGAEVFRYALVPLDRHQILYNFIVCHYFEAVFTHDCR